MSIMIRTAAEMASLLGARVEHLRLTNHWKRGTLAARSGVSEASLKRFETTGKISLESLLQLAQALGRLQDFEGLLEAPPARSIADLDRLEAAPRRRRGRR